MKQYVQRLVDNVLYLDLFDLPQWHRLTLADNVQQFARV